jgi:hypothetical protein
MLITRAAEGQRSASHNMGYDLHITRKIDWNDDDGPIITEAEWRALIETDPELSLDVESQCTMADGEYVFAAWNGGPGLLGYYAGEISTKNPEKPLISKMVRIAQKLGAEVQGDEGEIYREDGTSLEPESAAAAPLLPSMLSRVVAWLRNRRVTRELQDAAPAFRVGQRVKNPWGELGTVLNVNRKANGGLGSVYIRLDDGREQHLALVASGLEIFDGSPSDGN